MATNKIAVTHIPMIGWSTPLKKTSSPNPAQKLTKKIRFVSISKFLTKAWYLVNTGYINFIEIMCQPTYPKHNPEPTPTKNSRAKLVLEINRLKNGVSNTKKWMINPRRGKPISVATAKGTIDFLVILYKI